MKLFSIIALALMLSGCGACYQENKNPDGSWPSWCADRFNSPNPTKQ